MKNPPRTSNCAFAGFEASGDGAKRIAAGPAQQVRREPAKTAGAVLVASALIRVCGAVKVADRVPAAGSVALTLLIARAVAVDFALGIEACQRPMSAGARTGLASPTIAVNQTTVVFAMRGMDDLFAMATGRSAAIRVRLAYSLERFVVADRAHSFAFAGRVAARLSPFRSQAAPVGKRVAIGIGGTGPLRDGIRT